MFLRSSKFSFLLIPIILLLGCIDPITFDTGNESRRIVIEALITNISYEERLSLPAVPERFYARVQYTGPVNNERNELIEDATVTLYDDQENSWNYVWDDGQQQYILPFDDFAAEEGRTYYLEVRLANGDIYESQKEVLRPVPPLADVKFELETRVQEIVDGEQSSFENQRGVVLSARIPENSANEEYYLRYRALPSWIYVAPLPPEDSPIKTCYVTNKFYFQKIVRTLDRTGDYYFDLFFLETENNSRLQHDFTAYVTQYSLSPAAYNFWDELAVQQESGGNIFDPPPFELTSNFRNVNDPDEKVSGLFSVAHESSVRWFINGDDLPYEIVLDINPCAMPPYTPDCLSCLEYRGGSSSNTNIKPSWWR